MRFEAAAERARSQLEDADAPPLLHDHALYIHLSDRARKLMGANAAALKRVAGVLGGKVGGWVGRVCGKEVGRCWYGLAIGGLCAVC